MALDLTGIENRGEFYSHHYLDALLESDLKPLLQQWADAESATPPVRAPYKRLGGLAGRYFDARAQAAELGPQALSERWQLAHAFHAHLLDALGYTRSPQTVELPGGTQLPLLHEERRGGQAALWVIEAPAPQPDQDPLDAQPLRDQYPQLGPDTKTPELTWRELLDRELFRHDDAPTWVLFLGGSEIVLTHRHKWGRGQALAFDLDALYARRQSAAFRAMAALLHQQALVPSDGVSLHEHLDESSHKHAFSVSGDLRRGAEQAIEILGNETAWYLRTVRRRGVFGSSESAESVDPTQLTRELLVYLYRLIFLFYVESRSDALGVVPMRSESYRRGYSLESLRDLEQVPLSTPQAQEGYFLHHSLQQLFKLVNQGHGVAAQQSLNAAGMDAAGFRIRGLHSRLFDDTQLSILARVRFRNAALQRVIQLLSLSEEGKHRQRGRISYASLGINQLGAVYEGLLSYTGFFAKVDLIEVANPEKKGKPDARSFFVPESHIDRYDDAEVVRDPKTGARKRYPRGSYLYRLAGRDREKSASFYTPEVLTRALVRYTLQERIGKDGAPDALPADALLTLSICEPAMGSGAFLNEVIEQLAHAYLDRKSAELGQQIPAADYPRELQRVKAHMAATQCYGVDQNPLATELGKVSLWLNTLRPGAPAPFFDPRIVTGNSLVGARLAVYTPKHLHKAGKNKPPNWTEAAPEPLQGPRAPQAIYHFLLPTTGMAPFDGDKVVKALLPERVAELKAWHKTLKAAWSPAHRARLQKLSEQVDSLWEEVAAHRRKTLAACTPPSPVWPEPDNTDPADEDTLAATWRQAQDDDSAGKRLRAVMDYWCALWFWPLQRAAELPSREQWLADLELLLAGRRRDAGSDSPTARRLDLAAELAQTHRFVHWPLEFPEVLANGGFDVVVGNPPWIKLQWNEGGILSDLDPRLVIRRMSAKKMADQRAQTLEQPEALAAYLGEFEGLEGQKAFLNGVGNYPLLKGVQTNLYKAFLSLGWRVLDRAGIGGMFHQAGIFDDPKGGALRSHAFPRMRLVGLAKNQLSLFEGVTHQRPYCFTVWGGREDVSVDFRCVSNLFHPRTLDASLEHDGLGEVPGIKDDEGNWDLRGHCSRIVHVDQATLGLFAKLYDPPGTPALQARLPVVHSQEILSVLRKLAQAPRTLADLEGQFFATVCFDETGAQRNGTIKRDVRFPADPSEWVVSGPHFYVGTPFNKTPNEGCRHNQDYSVVDWMDMPADYLPRTNYVPACDAETYRERTPHWQGRPVTESFRHVHRRMAPPTGERTLALAILPPGAAHTHTVISFTYSSPKELVASAGFFSSIPYDFFAKSTGKSDIYEQTIAAFARPEAPTQLISRALRLNCLTAHYADLWSELYQPDFAGDTHTKTDPRLPDWSHLVDHWTWDTPLRSPFSRRQALVELDALAAIALGLTAEELCLIYRVQFPVLRGYESDTWYDQRGRIVFTNNRGLNGVGLSRKEWNEIRDAQPGDPLPEWARDNLGCYQPPFDRCDREADMTQAYNAFVARGVTQ